MFIKCPLSAQRTSLSYRVSQNTSFFIKKLEHLYVILVAIFYNAITVTKKLCILSHRWFRPKMIQRRPKTGVRHFGADFCTRSIFLIV